MIVEFLVGLNDGDSNQRLSMEAEQGAKMAALRYAGRVFGGCNITRGEGSWLNDGELVIEECLNVRVMTVNTNSILAFAHALRKLFGQKVVAVNYLDTITSVLVTAEDEYAAA